MSFLFLFFTITVQGYRERERERLRFLPSNYIKYSFWGKYQKAREAVEIDRIS
jgi:hypothetical protein